MKFITALVVGLLLPFTASAQLQKSPATWSFSTDKKAASVGDVVTVRLKAAIADGWYMYSNDFDPNLGPNLAVIKINPSDAYTPVGKATPVGAKEKFEEVWNGNVRYFTHEALFTQQIKVLKPNPSIGGSVEYSTCSLKDGTCLPPAETEFLVEIKSLVSATPSQTTVSAVASVPKASSVVVKPTSQTTAAALAQTPVPTVIGGRSNPTVPEASKAPESTLDAAALTTTEPADTSMAGFIVAAFLSGLLALLTPCVFPIIPMTVSFFTNQPGGRWKALLFGASIIGIYVLVGTVVSRINGPAFANFVSTHWLPNLLFFAIFFVFGLSFLGLFEIVLPSSLVNSADARAERGGLAGVFFMAFTLVLVSFSCTGPIVGSLLVASAGGEVVKPIIGMVAFSSAFAVPFTLFAAFPQWLKSMPKSGGWLNAVKVVLGFLELALALKFLSIADQVYHWNVLDREVFLSIWVVIFSLIGFYFLGKIRLPHDSETKNVSVPRLLLAILTFSFVVYMIPGLWGAPLKALSGYLPPKTTQDFDLYERPTGVSVGNALGEVPKYANLFELPHNLQGFFDYKQALAYAKRVNKPVFIDFTGHGCVNCREMEERVWRDPAVLSRLQNDFVVVALYVDDKTELPEADWYTSTYDRKVKKTIGAQNADIQITKYNNNAQPHYCLVDSDGKLLIGPKNYDRNVENFVAFLDAGKARL